MVHAVCRNCGVQLHGRYCHSCGQDVFVGAKRSVKDLVFNALENMFALDNKIFSTLKYLIFFPGKLSLEYKNGRVTRYVHPSKLFWFITIVFFTTFSLYIHKESKTNDRNNIHFSTLKKSADETGDKTLPISEIRNKNENEITNKETKVNSTEINTDDKKDNDSELKEKFISIVTTYAPYISFLLIPFFAFLLMLFFRGKNYFYTDHFSFALHFHSFIFLLFGVYLGITYYFPDIIDYTNTIFFIVIPTVYLSIALYVFYRPRKKRTLIWKILLLNFIYFIIVITITIFLVVLLTIHLKFLGWEDFS